MWKKSGFTALLLFSATVLAQQNSIDTARIYSSENYKHEFVPGEFIVGFKSGKQDFADTSFPARTGVRSRRNLATARRPGFGTQTFSDRKLVLMSSRDNNRDSTLAKLNRLRGDANVEYVEPNYVVHANNVIPNDSSFSLLWGLQNTGQLGGTPQADIDATDAWVRTQGNPNLLIGIIDTGIDYLHPDLLANIWTNPGEIPGNGIDDDGNGYVDDIHGYNFVNNTGNPMDDQGHGTHCAGTIAGVGNNGKGVAGVVWSAKLVGLKFLDSTGNGTTAAAINAITYANAMGISITNNSWSGGGFSQALKNAIDAAGTKGYLFIAAAGNGINNNGVANNNDATPQYPASYTSSNIIAVAATDVNDANASFSNYGLTSVDLAAPGVSIYSTKPGNAYQYLSGTSMATPQVTGAVALIWGYNQSLTRTQVKTYLLQGVDSLATLSGRVVSRGRLNVKKALDLALPPIITYTSPILSAIKGVTITPDTVVSSGGTITSYAMAPSTPLPTGLTLNMGSGLISGTPTVVLASANDTIIATGPNGKGRTVVNIAVADTAPKISYKRTTISATKHVTITPDTVLSTGGAITSYAMAASTLLPSGLTLSGTTGIISGIPSTVTSAVNDTVIATGPGGNGKTVVNIAVVDTSPAISYKHTSISAVKNVGITPDTVVITGTGAITGYAMAVSTPLPAGLTISGTSGIISGIPTTVTSAVNDTVLATGPGGTGRTVVNVAVADTAPNISYKRSAITGVKHVSILPDTIVVTGSGAITGYSVNPPLPAGLSLNALTGLISGTPTSVTVLVNDTVTATGPGGFDKTIVSITVQDTAPAISYKRTTISATKNVPITPDTVVVTGTGAITGYAMAASTPLPAGLTISGTSGIISGIPIAVTPASNDTVIAIGPGGAGKTVVNIAVTDTAPGISYKRSTIVGVKNVSILPDTVEVTGSGIITGYSVSPALPSGLSLNPITGLISGTPTSVTALVNDTVTATGPGGVDKTVVSITIQDTAPAISYKHTTISAIKNIAIIPDTVVVTGTGAITSYAMAVSTPLPAGLMISGTTGIISGIPTAVSLAVNDTVIVIGPGGIGKTVVNIAVTDTAPGISYKRSSIVGIKNVAILPDTVVTGSGTITGYTVSPALPSGLSLNPITGLISGIPTVVTVLVNDTILATGPGGVGKTIVTITVIDTTPKFSYRQTVISATRNQPMTPDSVLSTGGAITSFAMSPSTPLPTGLFLNATSGIISGTPTVQSLAANYTILATGPGGNASTVVSIAVNAVPANLSYVDDPVTYVLNVPITPNTPSVTGIITHYSVSPALPSGLSLDTSSGVISGTPTGTQSFAADYTVTANNASGTTTGTINITIVGVPTNLSYVDNVPTYGLGIPIIPPNTPTIRGIVVLYSISPPLPSGIIFDLTTGYIQGTPLTVSSAKAYTITGQNPGGSVQTTVSLSVINTP